MWHNEEAMVHPAPHVETPGEPLGDSGAAGGVLNGVRAARNLRKL